MFTLLRSGIPVSACKRCRRFLSDGHSPTCSAVQRPDSALLEQIRAHADAQGPREGSNTTLEWKPWEGHSHAVGDLAYAGGQLLYAVWCFDATEPNSWRAGEAYNTRNGTEAGCEFGTGLIKEAAHTAVQEAHCKNKG